MAVVVASAFRNLWTNLVQIWDLRFGNIQAQIASNFLNKVTLKGLQKLHLNFSIRG